MAPLVTIENDPPSRHSRRTRTETDSLGTVEIPEEAYWGIHTARALDNFPISGRPIAVHSEFVKALAMVKQASALANRDIGALDSGKAELIDRACQEVIAGRFHEQFVVDVIQGGAGTSTNMNANEVITNIALELAGGRKGDYEFLSPIDDTNRGQSTNDVYPTALKIGLSRSLACLFDELQALRSAFSEKAEDFGDVLKVGRTQLQDAVPMTLGLEFGAFATTLESDLNRLRDDADLLLETNMGATAIGTGVTAHPMFGPAVLEHLRRITGFELRAAVDLVEATASTSAFLSLSSGLKRTAVHLSKLCNDLRLLSSGPRAGLGEITLPARQAGSSIMPGKINPVIPEVVNQVAFAVVGAEATVTMAAEAGQLQLNAFGPVIAHTLFESACWTRQAVRSLRINCVEGISANRDHLSTMVAESVGVVTALTPLLGYAVSAELAKAALEGERRVADLIIEAGLMAPAEVARYLSPRRLSGLEPVTDSISIVP